LGFKGKDGEVAKMNYYPKLAKIIKVCDGQTKNWEIVMWPTKEVNVSMGEKIGKTITDRKLNVYIELLLNDVVLPPLIVDEEGFIKDGWHRLTAYKIIRQKTVPVLRPVGKGTGKIIRDEYYQKLGKGEFYFPYKKFGVDHEQFCLICGRKLSFMKKNTTPGPLVEYPDGMPGGPFYYCKPCGSIIKEGEYIIWRKIGKDINNNPINKKKRS